MDKTNNMKLIKLSSDHYVIVDDSPLQKGDWFLTKENIVHNNYGYNYGDKKITHSTQPLEYTTEDHLQWDKIKRLSILEVKELIGEVDVENNAIEWYNGQSKYYNSNYVADPYSWKEGYNQALEDNKDRKYTEEDMRAVFMHGFSLGVEYLLGVDRGDYSIDMEDRAMSHYTQPKTQWEVEFIDGKLKLI